MTRHAAPAAARAPLLGLVHGHVRARPRPGLNLAPALLDDRTPSHPVDRIAARRRDTLVVLAVAEVWAFQATERLCFVHSARGRFDVDLSLQELEVRLGSRFVRVHRSWLVQLDKVREYGTEHGETCLVVGQAPSDVVRVPVSRESATEIRARLLVGTVGFRQRRKPTSIP